MTVLLLVLVFVLALWWLFTPARPAWISAPLKFNPQKTAEQARERAISTGAWFQHLPALWKKKPTLGALLQAWAQSDALAATGLNEAQSADLFDFRVWIASQPPAEVEAVAQECAEFCKAQRINLRWLLDDHGRSDMQKSLAALVVFFGLAVRERSGARASVALRAWQDAPLTKANREFGKHLYVELVNAGLIAIPSHMLMASQKERQTHLVNSIKALIVKDRAAILPYAEVVINPACPTPAAKTAQPAGEEAPGSTPIATIDPQPATV